MKYVKVVIDQVSNHTDVMYTYRCMDDSVRVGNVVRVPFGKGNRLKTAYVFQVADENLEEVKRLKDVAEISEEYVIPEDLMELCCWMKERYLCRYIDAIRCVIPPGNPPKRRAMAREEVNDPQAQVEPELTPEQQEAMNLMMPHLLRQEYAAFLLNGVTSSGKTEIYMRIAAQVLESGRRALILVPEISLTPQTISRFTGRFGADRVAVTHSRMTKPQRYEQWMKIQNGQADIIIGVRSAVLMPVSNIGAIIIDEEHESSYKSDMTPKYDAIDVAVERCLSHNALLLLGSATPSVVSRYRAEKGLYTEIKLLKRYNRTPLPKVEIADMREELRRGNRSIFSVTLYNRIKEELAAGRQAILFLNRRGYSSFVSCRSCGYVMKCTTCDVSLTFHKTSGMAECHYCGRRERIPQTCPSCGSPYIRHFGIGTEKVEELARETFPEAVVARLDLDTVKRKGEAGRIIDSFRKKKTDILVGTQLVAKGLDFDNVGVVGIVSADITLNIPDYRSAERTYQLIVQASGRAGRGDRQGSVVIQTYSPEDPVIRAAAASNYNAFYDYELRMRRLAGYPPFTHIIRLVFSHENEDNVRNESQAVYQKLAASEKISGSQVLPPQPAYMAHLNGSCRYQLLIKSPVDRTADCLEVIADIREERIASPDTKTIMLTEVDPYSMT